MDAREFQRKLAKLGCKFSGHRGGSGHLTITRGNRTSQLPMHGKGKDLGKKLIAKILKDLNIKE